MWPFDLFHKKEDKKQLPDLIRSPVSPEFSEILKEYDAVAGKEVLALCLEGGGAKGRAQLPFIVRLAEIGVLSRVNVIAGTSVGGLNAVMTSRYMKESPNLQAVVDVWRSITGNSDVYLGEVPAGVTSVIKPLLSGRLTAESWLDVSPLRQLVRKHLGGIVDLPVPTYTVTTNYFTKSENILGPGTPAEDMALATSAIPGMFPAHNGQFMDGGCVQNLPISFLLDGMKATKIVSIYCGPDPSKEPTSSAKPTTISTALAAITALSSVQASRAYDDLEAVAKIREMQGLSPVEVMQFYPAGATPGILSFGDDTDCMQREYETAVKYMTPEKIRKFLLS